ncbi:hypothetical protein DPMN_080203 [Dreissena polymorpha]|uniref:Uncharacterized protein n=1 Tax=Dreissena polymorpha TaxID=45954 RepID=A0A9D4BRK6_DREPO|nr:hypothetical protein DPMN_080203 [Dreissena polymorpha]
MATLRGTVEELLPVDKERKQHAVGTESPCAFSSIHDDLPNQLCVEAAVQDPTEWPALSATEVPVQEHDSTIALFSDIVQTIQDKVDASEVPEDEINVPSNIHCHRDTEETPQQDDNAANEDKVNVPSHFFFQRDTDETPQQDVDTSQLLLILSNDVELNPGPIFQTIPVPVEAVGSSEKMTIITVKMD